MSEFSVKGIGKTKDSGKITNKKGQKTKILPKTITKDTFNRQTSQQVDLKTLPGQFIKTENDYANKIGQVTDSSMLSNYFYFTVFHLDAYDTINISGYRTGKEVAFMKALREETINGKKLSPEDMYRIALKINDGDRFKALINVHDAIKMTGRANQVGTDELDDKKAKQQMGRDINGKISKRINIKDLVGEEYFNEYVKTHGGEYDNKMANNMGEQFLKERLMPIGDSDDTTGKYYHLFGTAAGRLCTPLATIGTYAHGIFKNIKYTSSTKWECDKTGIEIANQLNENASNKKQTK